MGYYVRAFCTSPAVPDLASIQTWLRAHKSAAVIDDPGDTSDWEHAEISYRAGKLPILAECNRDDGTPDCLMRTEVAEFVEFVEEAGASEDAARVLKHLTDTKFIIACQLPSSDIEDAGIDANGDFLSYFVLHSGGMIQADGEGFYDGGRLILALK